MRKIFAIAAIAAALATAAAGASSASAAVEFGSSCVADEAAPEYTLTTLSSPGPLSVAAPSNGVITKVRVAISPEMLFPFAVPSQVKTIRPLGSNVFSVTGQASAKFSVGVSSSNVRLPVLAGDRLALRGEPFVYESTPIEGLTLYCDEGVPGSILGASEQPAPVGSTVLLPAVTEAAIPLVATLEPDADNDGFGDETQDGCPQSAAIQTVCPVVTVDAINLVGKKAVTVLVTTSIAAPVKVSGAVKLGNGETVKLNAGPKTVAPGKFTRFKLKFNSALKERLNELEPGKKLTLKITASATNVAGQVSTDKQQAKLKGQG